MVAVGKTERDPEAPYGEKPTPVQEVALVDDHESVDETPGGTLAGFALNETGGAVGDTAATAYCATHPVRPSLKATPHQVYVLLAGPPMTAPWLPGHSWPIAGVFGVGVE